MTQQDRPARWFFVTRPLGLAAGLAALQALAGTPALAAPAVTQTAAAVPLPRPAPLQPTRDTRQAIDCAASRLSVRGGVKCWTWTFGLGAYMRYDRWTEDSQDGPTCVHEWQAVRTKKDGFIGYVKSVNLAADASIWCSLGGWGSVNLYHIHKVSTRAENAKDLTYPVRSGDRFVSSFVSSEGRSCRAFIVLGPHVVNFRFKDATAYHIEGDLCAPVGGTISDSDLDSYLSSIRLAAR